MTMVRPGSGYCLAAHGLFGLRIRTGCAPGRAPAGAPPSLICSSPSHPSSLLLAPGHTSNCSPEQTTCVAGRIAQRVAAAPLGRQRPAAAAAAVRRCTVVLVKGQVRLQWVVLTPTPQPACHPTGLQDRAGSAGPRNPAEGLALPRIPQLVRHGNRRPQRGRCAPATSCCPGPALAHTTRTTVSGPAASLLPTVAACPWREARLTSSSGAPNRAIESHARQCRICTLPSDTS